ncbi:hypothetical protein A9E89_15080 (plasmid) [Legionella pneumophila]|nr:hypothetical protein A9E85_15420 [Legionella pneumophila]AOU62534.1 hypothetical protein A9E89_15080 [Legionella pneumophila]ERH41388.1 hypothetical protein N750_16815 [Legionella pneumophila str. Leg01/53]ERI46797.1 hypothetical protein N749_16545 [Legionella pneumophila str. Leg01/20]
MFFESSLLIEEAQEANKNIKEMSTNTYGVTKLDFFIIRILGITHLLLFFNIIIMDEIKVNCTPLVLYSFNIKKTELN